MKLTVTLKDSKGNPVTDKTVNIVQIDDNGNSSIVGPAEKNDDGTYKFTPKLDKDGNYKFGFTVNSEKATSMDEVKYEAESNGDDDGISGGSASFEKSSIKALKNQLTTGESVDIIVTLKDGGKDLMNKEVVIRNHKGVEVGKAKWIKGGEYKLSVTSKRNLIDEYYYEVDGKDSKNYQDGSARVQWVRLKGTVRQSYNRSTGYITTSVQYDDPRPSEDDDWELFDLKLDLRPFVYITMVNKEFTQWLGHIWQTPTRTGKFHDDTEMYDVREWRNRNGHDVCAYGDIAPRASISLYGKGDRDHLEFADVGQCNDTGKVYTYKFDIHP